jgi:MipA family protein
MPFFPLRAAAFALTVLILFPLAATRAAAQASPPENTTDEPAGLPLWEAGVVAGGWQVPDYPGADQSHARGIVAPVFIYRGRVLRVDQGAIRGRLFDTPDWEFDLSATGAFNARDNEFRRGMPGLDYLFGVGPQLIYKGWQRGGSGPSLHLKTRALFSTDLRHFDRRGFSIDPDLRWRFLPAGLPRGALTLSVQPTWASRALHQYFYEVAPAFATPTRPAYVARSGYLGTDLVATLSRREGRSLSWFLTARALSLHGAANRESPLLRDRSNFTLGAGLVWTPWHSAARAPE